MTGVRLESGVFSMNKREFLAMGGAVPLMLAGCGGSSTGSAPMRLVNASVGYPTALGFTDESTQITTGVAYGAASPFFNVEAGQVHLALTTTIGGAETSATAAQLRTLNKDQRYSLVAFGLLNELRFVPLAELNTTPDANTASVNVLNTSADIGSVDVYLSTAKDLSVATLLVSGIVASTTAPSQSGFATDIKPGTYYVTVVGNNNLNDVRFQTPTPITLTALQILTIILTPGAGGSLANAIMLTQGTAGTSTPVQNTTARVRAITSTNGLSAQVTGTDNTGKAITILGSNTTPQYSNYFVTNTGSAPTVVVNGATITPFMIVNGASVAATMAAGGDYTLMVYVNGSTPVAQLIADDNTAPTIAQGSKFRLINLASNNQGLQMTMQVNSINVASQVPYGTASAYTQIATPQATASVAEVFNGDTLLATHTKVIQLGNIFTEIVTSVDPSTGVTKDIFQAANTPT
jgi:hypothetical protein